MYALVVFILTFITVARAHDRQRGGHGDQACARRLRRRRSPRARRNPVTAEPAACGSTASHASRRSRAPQGSSASTGWTNDVLWNVTAFDDALRRAAVRRVLEDRGSYAIRPSGLGGGAARPAARDRRPGSSSRTAAARPSFAAEPGTRISLKDPYTGRTRVAHGRGDRAGRLLHRKRRLLRAPGRAEPVRLPARARPALRRPAPGHRRRRVRRRRAGDASSRNGTEAVSIRTIMDEGFTMTRQIFQLFQGYLAMGLIVGIAGTAVVDGARSSRAPTADRDAPRDRLRRAIRRPQLRDRDRASWPSRER